jgi:hypothetical protein
MSDIRTSNIRSASPAERRARLDAIFTPNSPVTRRELFAGRTQAIQQMLEIADQPGRHVVLFGEPAVGKTSLASIVPAFHDGPMGSVRVAAEPGDTFASLWRRAAESVRTMLRRAERGLSSSPFPSDVPTTVGRDGHATVEDVLFMLARLGAGAPCWIVFDDFDRITDEPTRTLMREVAESTAMPAPKVTLVFCGRAASGDALLPPSMSFVPVRAARFTADESYECVLRALRLADVTAGDVVVERIAVLGNGIPQAVQALARAAAMAAAGRGSSVLDVEDLDAGMVEVLADAEAAVRVAYEQATVRARRGIYPEILLASALAPRDEAGRFAVADVCDAVTRIVQREVRGLTNQVSALTEEGRGAVLEKQGAAKEARYRFVDPRLEPYILLKGLEEGWATHHTHTWLPGIAETVPDETAQAA